MPLGILIMQKKNVEIQNSKIVQIFLYGGNAAGDMKLKPLIVYHSNNPSAVKGYTRFNLRLELGV